MCMYPDERDWPKLFWSRVTNAIYIFNGRGYRERLASDEQSEYAREREKEGREQESNRKREIIY
jgi:hypothetical protein